MRSSEAITAAQLLYLTVAFALISTDVNVDSSLHLFSGIDAAVHISVSSNIPLQLRMIADHLVSDTPIALGAIASLACITEITRRQPKQGLSLLMLLLAMNAMVGGVFAKADAKITTELKQFFHRSRPSDDLHHSFSFPSGHATSVYFTLGFLFLVLVPSLNCLLMQDRKLNGVDLTKSWTYEEIVATVARPQVGLLLTVLGASVTQTGRLLADVHWFSDVCAGAVLGSWGVVLSILLVQEVHKVLHTAELP
jgi:membrane-associated phospholipid phosphatase